MSNKFTQKLKDKIIYMIKSDMLFETPDKFIKDFYAFIETLMYDEEKSKMRFLQDGCPGFHGQFYAYRHAEDILGDYFKRTYLIFPDRLLELKEFNDYTKGIYLKTTEFLETVKQVENTINACNGFREFNQILPQFKPYLDKAKEELYGQRLKTQNLPAKPVEIANLDKYMKVSSEEAVE